MKIGAAIASLFIAGGGQFVRGRLWRGLIFVGLDAALLVNFVMVARRGYPFWPPLVVLLMLHVSAAVDAARGPDGKQPLPIGAIAGLLCTLGIAPIVFGLVARAYFVEAFKIPSGSMAPTLLVGDHIFIDKAVKEAHRGDVIVFRYPKDPRKDFIKRTVAIAGDTVEQRGVDLIINGTLVPHTDAGPCSYEDFHEEIQRWETKHCHAFDETLDGNTYRVIYDDGDRRRDFGPFTIGPGEFFVIGDNRDNSHDSRWFGNVPAGYLRGRALSVWWSIGPDGRRKERQGLQIH
jgi:signal peptidase I